MNKVLAKLTPAQKWDRVEAKLRISIGMDYFEAFFSRVKFQQTTDGKMVLTVLHASTASHIRNVYLDEIRRIWTETHHEEPEWYITLRNLSGNSKIHEQSKLRAMLLLEKPTAETKAEVEQPNKTERVIASACTFYKLDQEVFREHAYAQAFAIYLLSVLTTLTSDEIAKQLCITKQHGVSERTIVDNLADAVNIMLSMKEIDIGAVTQIKKALGYESPLLEKQDELSIKRRPEVRDIIGVVSIKYEVPIELILSETRKHTVVQIRQIAMYLSHQLTVHSLNLIGKFFNNRDHSTVHHSITKVKERMKEDAALRAEIEELKTFLMS